MPSVVTEFIDELHTEILSWLPVNTLMRFRCVCRAWNSLILDPTFADLHLQRSSKNTHILITFCENGSNTADPSSIRIKVTARRKRLLLENPLSTLDGLRHLIWIPPTATQNDMDRFFNSTLFIVGVCNGLLCAHFRFSDGQQQELYQLQFWNPATRISSDACPGLLVKSYNIPDYAVKFGFGYDDSSKTYKVVAIIFDIQSKIWEIKVHCLGDSCWRRVLTRPYPFPILQNEHGQFVTGTLNWLAVRSSVSYDPLIETVANNGNASVIFSFDLKHETYRFLSLPDGLADVYQERSYLGVLSGCLCLSHDHEGTSFVVWLMRDFGTNSWTKLLKVDYTHLQAPCPPFFSRLPLCMSENNDLLLMTSRGRGRFVLLDQENERADHIENYTNEYEFCSTFSCFDFVFSLVLPCRTYEQAMRGLINWRFSVD